jgi:hypothetical protein
MLLRLNFVFTRLQEAVYSSTKKLVFGFDCDAVLLNSLGLLDLELESAIFECRR